MPKFTVDHETKFNDADAFAKIKEFLGKDDGIRRFDPKMNCDFNESNKTCQIKGSQFKADLQVAKLGNGGSKVSVTVDLPLMLTPFKGKVQETLLKQLSKYLG
ncbi:MAG: polyhydroxyalkanoic acid system family protein [Bdellovibrionia bacterium]